MIYEISLNKSIEDGQDISARRSFVAEISLYRELYVKNGQRFQEQSILPTLIPGRLHWLPAPYPIGDRGQRELLYIEVYRIDKDVLNLLRTVCSEVMTAGLRLLSESCCLRFWRYEMD